MVYYYGIFANRVKAKYLKIINTLYPSPRIYPRITKTFRGRFVLWTGKDPLRCSCG
jgi:hypothetical protein